MKILDVPRSGSYQAITSSHNRAGQYVRNRRTPVNPPGTGRRGFIRAAFGASSTQWSGLTTAQQASWTSFADGHPITDRLGQSIKLTGHQMFVAVSTQLQNIGESISLDPPTSTTTLAPGGTFAATGSPSATFTFTPDGGGDTGDFVLLAFSPPMSTGRTFNNRWWQQLHYAANSSTLIDLLAAYQAEFGTVITGTRIFWKLTPVNGSGWTGTPVIGFIDVA